MGNNNCQECVDKETHAINELLLESKFFKDSIDHNNPNASQSSRINSLKVSREDLKKAIENTNLSKEYKDYVQKIIDDNELKESGEMDQFKLGMANNNNNHLDENNVNNIENAPEQKNIVEEQNNEILEEPEKNEENLILIEKEQQKKTSEEKKQGMKVINLGHKKEKSKKGNNSELHKQNEDNSKNVEKMEKNENIETNVEIKEEKEEKNEKIEKNEKDEEESLNIIQNPQENTDKKSKQENNDNNEMEEEVSNKPLSAKFKIETYEPNEQGLKNSYGIDYNNNSSNEKTNNYEDNKDDNDENDENEYAKMRLKHNEPTDRRKPGKNLRKPKIQKGDKVYNIAANINKNRKAHNLQDIANKRENGPKDSERNNHNNNNNNEHKYKGDFHNDDINNNKEEYLEYVNSQGDAPKDSRRKDLEPKLNKNQKISQSEQMIQIRQKKQLLNENSDNNNIIGNGNRIAEAISSAVLMQKNKSLQNIKLNGPESLFQYRLEKKGITPYEKYNNMFPKQPKIPGINLNKSHGYYSQNVNELNHANTNKSYHNIQNYDNYYVTYANKNDNEKVSEGFY